MEILRTIRDNHVSDSTTADTTSIDAVKDALKTATNFEGSAEKTKVAMFLGQLGIKYNNITKDELV